MNESSGNVQSSKLEGCRLPVTGCDHRHHGRLRPCEAEWATRFDDQSYEAAMLPRDTSDVQLWSEAGHQF